MRQPLRLVTLVPAILAVCVGASSDPARGQSADVASYPNRPVRVVVPFAAGAGTDILARLASEELSRKLGQRFVVENVPGAGGIIGAAQVARATPDGYTLLAGTPGSITTGAFIQEMTYDPIKDLQPISMIAEGPGLMVVGRDSRFKSVRDVIAEAKAKPGSLNFGSSGTGAFSHYNGEVLKSLAGLDMTHIAYRGAAPAILDVIAGRIDFIIEYFPAVQSFVSSGELRAIGVTSPQRYPLRPDIPTMSEQGVAGFNTAAWVGLFAPAGTPRALVLKVQQEIARAVREPAMLERLKTLGVIAGGNTPEEYASYLAAERDRVKALVASGGLKLK